MSTAIEHKAVLEPLEYLQSRGFEVELVPPQGSGWVEAASIDAAVRDDTLLVSVMHVNNETGVIQPLGEIADALGDRAAFFHTDAAQGYGKELELLRHPRIDLISISAHKIYGPKGIGALINRRRGADGLPLRPLMYGGGQERGLRPGTAPVPLVVGMGQAARIAAAEHASRQKRCLAFREKLLSALSALGPMVNGDLNRSVANVVNVSLGAIDGEAVMLVLQDLVAISNGAACTSSSYDSSHVLSAMGIDEERINAATRWSWSHQTQDLPWESIVGKLRMLG